MEKANSLGATGEPLSGQPVSFLGLKDGIGMEPIKPELQSRLRLALGVAAPSLRVAVVVLAATISLQEDANELLSVADGRRLAFDFSRSTDFPFQKKKKKRYSPRRPFLVLDFNKVTYEFLTLLIQPSQIPNSRNNRPSEPKETPPWHFSSF